MGSSVYCDRRARQRRALRDEPQPAVRACSRARSSRSRALSRHEGREGDEGHADAKDAPRVSAAPLPPPRSCAPAPSAAAPAAVPRGPGGRVAAFPRDAALTGVSATTIPPRAEVALDLGGRAECRRLVRGDCRRCRLHRHGHRRAARHWRSPRAAASGATRRASRLASRRRRSSGGRVYIGDLDGVVHAVNVADGKAAWTFKTHPRSNRRRSSSATWC